jgi:hypothetical protein
MAWKAANRTNRLRTHVAHSMDLKAPRSNADEFYLVLQATCPKSKKTISKFAIALSNAEAVGAPTEGFEAFLKRIGGPTTIHTRAAAMTLSRTIRQAKKARRGKGG